MNTMDKLIEESQKYQDLILEYFDLTTRETLTEEEADRLEVILEQAQVEPLLGFLVDEADHIIGHELGLIDKSSIERQQQHLRQVVDQRWIDIHIQQSLIRKGQIPESCLKSAQACLKDEGLYAGLIDGIYGPVTQQAFRLLRQKLQDDLQERGLAWASIDEACNLENQKLIGLLLENGAGIDPRKLELLNLEAWLVCSR